MEKVGRTRVKGTEWDLELRDAVRDVLGELKRGEEEFEWKESIVMTSVGNWWERWIDQIGVSFRTRERASSLPFLLFSLLMTDIFSLSSPPRVK